MYAGRKAHARLCTDRYAWVSLSLGKGAALEGSLLECNGGFAHSS